MESQDIQGGAHSVSQVNGVSDMVPTCQVCGFVGGGFRKGTIVSQSVGAPPFFLLRSIPLCKDGTGEHYAN